MAIALGLDIGTSKIAAVLLDGETRQVLDVASLRTNAELSPEPEFAEQDVRKIFHTLEKAIRDLEPDLLKRVAAVGITGQMHGVVLWHSQTNETSNLVSWQDRRCSRDGFLHELNERLGDHAELRDGYGCATLSWFAHKQPDTIKHFDRATTIHDYIAARLCGLNEGITDPTDAASWGMFDPISENWRLVEIEKAGIPSRLLPTVRPCGAVLGKISNFYATRLDLQPGTPVMVPLGDNQSSLLATLSNPSEEIALTLGTGGQLSVIVPKDLHTFGNGYKTIELRPYPGEKLAAVAASLCGGKAFDWVNETVLSWCRTLGIPLLDKDELFTRLNKLGMECTDSPLRVSSNFIGERFDPARRAEIKNIDLANFSLGNLAAAVVRDVVENLKNMMPPRLLEGRLRVVGSGNGIRKLPLMQRTIEEVFGLPLVLPETVEEAASGAALHALKSLQR